MPMLPEPLEVAMKVEGVKPASTWMLPAPLVACTFGGCLMHFVQPAALPAHLERRPAGLSWSWCFGQHIV